MPQLSLRPETEKRIFRHVKADLAPSWSRVLALTASAVLLGGSATLGLCGQFGWGWTPWADDVTMRMHHALGPAMCMVACGAILALGPVLVLRLACSPLLFRVLVRRHWPLLLAEMAVLLLVLRTRAGDAWGVGDGIWGASAFLVAVGAAWLCDVAVTRFDARAWRDAARPAAHP